MSDQIQSMPPPPCELAVQCARSIANYCSTRFQCQACREYPTVTDRLDVPWFAEKVQKALQEGADENARLRAGLSMIAQIIHGSTRVTRMIAEATLDGANLLDEDVAIEVCEGHWRKP